MNHLLFQKDTSFLKKNILLVKGSFYLDCIEGYNSSEYCVEDLSFHHVFRSGIKAFTSIFEIFFFKKLVRDKYLFYLCSAFKGR